MTLLISVRAGAEVRFGSSTDVRRCQRCVPFNPESGSMAVVVKCQ
jgi:hypothetical protein